MVWRDQGWGNRKGQVLVIAKSKDGAIRVVYASKLAPHSRQKLRIGIQPQDDETYHLCYKVGDGGAHEINLYGIQLNALVYDDDLRLSTNAWNFISRALLRWDEGLFRNDSPLYIPYWQVLGTYFRTMNQFLLRWLSTLRALEFLYATCH